MTLAYRTLLFSTLLTLSQQLHAARFWVAATASNWNNSANWATTSGGAGGASVPGPTDAVNFDGGGLGNCTIDVPVSITKITVSAAYTGTITQGANTFTTSNTATFSGGSFAGGTADITFGNNFTLSGATFTSTSGTLEFDGNSSFTSGTFNHNNGSVKYVATGGASAINGVSPTFYNLEFVGEGFAYTINSTPDIVVNHNLNFTGTLFYNLNIGAIDANGDITASNTAAGCGGTATVNIVGTGTQNFTGSAIAGAGALPKVTINKPSGTLDLFNYPACSNAFTYTAGTVNAGTSTWCFTDGTAGSYAITGSLTFANIDFVSITPITFNMAAGTTLTATGNIAMTGTARITINTGTIDVDGNITLTNTALAGGGSAILEIVGAGNQTIDATALAVSQNILPAVTINKPSGTLTLKGIISVGSDWTNTAGTIDAATNASTVAFGGTGLNVTSAGMTFYHVTVTGNTITLLDNMTIAGNLTITGGKISPGSNTINLSGNWNNYGTTGFAKGTSTVNFKGSALQTITNPGGESFANLTANNTGAGIQLINNTTVQFTLTMNSGNIDLNGNTLALGISTGNNGTLSYTSGTIINTGTFTRWYKAAAIAGNTGLFPVGTASSYRPIIVSTTANPTTGGTISVSYTDATTNSAVSIIDGASTVLIRKDLSWALSTATLAGGTYNLQTQGTGFGVISNVSDLRLTLANGVVAIAGANGGTTTNPQVNRTGLSLADLTNTFYIGSVDPTFTTLPLTLVYFKGAVSDGGVHLYWGSATELTGDWFTVQRSKDGHSWETLVRLPSSATSDPAASLSGASWSWSATDPAPYAGTSFYRLCQADADGNSGYSAVLSFRQDATPPAIHIFPIPATDHFTISFSGTGKYAVSLLNSAGRMVREPMSSTGSDLALPVSGLPPGPYFIRIVHDGTSETRTVLVR
ncbi:MAG TPA: T9SS type A sorting domain-containing protein [Puia sp.]|nr:T9SS type A sorting domain-containing protein [Puia sp.]